MILGLLLGLAGAAAALDPTVLVQDGDHLRAVAPARLPRSGALLGTACSLQTSMRAAQVLDEGEPYVFVGRLHPEREGEVEGVACPYRLGGVDGACLIANELVEHADATGLAGLPLSIEGRMLQVDGIRFVVWTALVAAPRPPADLPP